jgi:hypothetical protein
VRVCSIRVDGRGGGITTDLFHDARSSSAPMAPGYRGPLGALSRRGQKTAIAGGYIQSAGVHG